MTDEDEKLLMTRHTKKEFMDQDILHIFFPNANTQMLFFRIATPDLYGLRKIHKLLIFCNVISELMKSPKCNSNAIIAHMKSPKFTYDVIITS